MTVQDRKLVHSDIKPEKSAGTRCPLSCLGKQPSFPGIKIKVLYTDDTGITTALFKLEPGAVVPLHEHAALEQNLCDRGVA